MDDRKRSNLFREPETNVYVDVESLTDEETKFKSELDYAKRQFLTWESTYKDLLKKCKHTVKYDDPGFPYDVRHCHLCGSFLELI